MQRTLTYRRTDRLAHIYMSYFAAAFKSDELAVSHIRRRIAHVVKTSLHQAPVVIFCSKDASLLSISIFGSSKYAASY